MSWFSATPERTEEIVQSLAGWVVSWEKAGDEPKVVAAMRAVLFGAAVIAYRHKTEHMGSREAADWVNKRVNRMITEWERVA